MEIENYFSNRATVRDYSDREVSNEVINGILEKAMRAPTCGNMQLYSVVVTRDNTNKEKLAALHFNQPAATGSNLILTICADFNRFSRWCELSEASPCYSNFHSFIMAATDAIIYAQQIVTIAELESLATCYLGTVNYTAKEISDLFLLPELVVPVASLSIGYPTDAPPVKTERLPLEAIVHLEHYRKDSDKEIKSLFKTKEEWPDNKRFVKENDKKTLAQVFTDIRYPLKTNETVSQTFINLLQEKGFI